MIGQKCEKVAKIFCCKSCDYYTSHKNHYNKHLSTLKHKMVINGNELVPKKEQEYNCICGKKYKYDSGYCRHKKICSVIYPEIQHTENIDSLTDKQLIINLLQQNAELQKSLIELSKEKTIINNNSNNKTFNLQFFLNETCKDALNINDFVSSIQLQLTDLETTGRVGYVEGISKIVIQNLNNI